MKVLQQASSDVLVSICCLSFNHEKYIAQTLDSFLSQKTSFKFEILVHDDASTDQTRKILLRYKKKFPDKFRLMLRRKNQYLNHRHYAIWAFFLKAKGTFVALCEGDDYWCDEYKLQKQVDSLMQHKCARFSFHRTRVQDDWKVAKCTIPSSGFDGHNNVLTPNQMMELIEYELIHFSSFMFRSDLLYPICSTFKKYNQIDTGDYFIRLICVVAGDSVFIDDTMSVYRCNVENSWTTNTKNDVDRLIVHACKMLKNVSALEEILGNNHVSFVEHHKREYALSLFTSACKKYGDCFRDDVYEYIANKLVPLIAVNDECPVFYGAGPLFNKIKNKLIAERPNHKLLFHVIDVSQPKHVDIVSGVNYLGLDDVLDFEATFVITPLFRCAGIEKKLLERFGGVRKMLKVDDFFDASDLISFIDNHNMCGNEI